MIKHLIIAFSICCTQQVHAQEFPRNSKFQGTIGYGVGLVGITPDLIDNTIVFKRANLGTFLNVTLEYEVATDKFVGFGYGFKQFVNTINQVAIRETSGVFTDNYKNIAQHHYYDLHLRRNYSNFNITVGVAYLVERYNDIREELIDEEFRVYLLFSEPSPTPITVFLALDYTFPLNDHVHLGLQGRVDYGVYGVDNLVFAPILRMKF